MILSKRQLFTFVPVQFICLFLFCLSLSGCDQQELPPPVKAVVAEQPSLTIGLIPEQDVFTQKKRYQPLIDLLAEELNVSIKIKMLPRYGNILDNFNQLSLDGAFFGSFTGAMAIERLGIVPLARPQYFGGSSSYYGMVFIKKGRDLYSAESLRGKRMVFVDRATTAGFLLPLAYFKKLGIKDYADWFDEYYFSGTHEDAINDVLNGHADIGAAKNTVFYRMAGDDKRILTELEILETSPHVPANGLAVRSDLDETLKQSLKSALLNLHLNAKGRDVLDVLRMEQFIETSAEDYQPVIDYADSIGLDLKSYNYLNR